MVVWSWDLFPRVTGLGQIGGDYGSREGEDKRSHLPGSCPLQTWAILNSKGPNREASEM